MNIKKPKQPQKPVEPKKIFGKDKEIIVEEYETLQDILNRVYYKFGEDVNLNELSLEQDLYNDCHVLRYCLEYKNPRYEKEMEVYNKNKQEYDDKIKKYESDLTVYEASDEYKESLVRIEEHKRKQKEADIKKLKKKLAELEK